MDNKLEQLKKVLNEKGLRYTKQREIILVEFLKTKSHISASELYKRISKKHKNIGFATVYRTLKVLMESGFVEGKSFGDGKARFEHSEKRAHHDHFICEKCGKIIEFYSPELEKIQEDIAAYYSFKIIRHDLQIFGLCNECKIKS